MSSQLVLPGQYITPAYKVNDGIIEKYISGKGTCLSYIQVNNQSVPVIVATILGQVLIKEIDTSLNVNDTNEDKSASSDTEQHKDVPTTKNFMVFVVSPTNSYINFEKELHQANQSTNTSTNLPKENDIVLVRITKITARQAYCEILSVEGFGNVLSDAGLGANGDSAHVSVPSGGGSQSLSNHQSIASSQSTSINAVAKDLGESFKGIIRSQDVRSTDRDKVKIIDSFKPGDIVRAIIISLGDGSNYYLSTAKK
jgi:exosome complex component CSL4